MTVWLDAIARAQIERESRRHKIFETGGPLFGFETDDEIVVVGAGGPGPRARHRPRSFCPNREAVDRAIARVHDAGDGRYRFLGSWHTHPLGRPTPSSIDIATARAISGDAATALPQPLLLVHATWPTRRTLRDSNLRAWRWSADDGALVPGRIRVFDGERPYPPLVLDWERMVR